MRRWTVALLLLALAAPGALAQEGEGEGDQEKEKPKYKEFAELVKDAEVHEGFLDLYLKDDKLYLAVAPERLGEEFLGEMKIA